MIYDLRLKIEDFIGQGLTLLYQKPMISKFDNTLKYQAKIAE
jgi:hypothetical protein